MPTRIPPSPLELVPRGDLAPSDVFASLQTGNDVACDPPTTAEWTYLDTHDGRLHAAGLTLQLSRPRSGRGLRLTLLANGAQVATHDLTAPRPSRVFVSDLPAGALREKIEDAVEMRALLPQAKLTSRRQPARVLDREAKTVARLLFEQPAVHGPGLEPAALNPRLHVWPVLGYDRAFRRVAAHLESFDGFRPAELPLVDEAIRAAGGAPGGVSARIGVRLQREMRADEATVALCRRLAEIVEANLPGSVADTDTEFLHDLRVAVRRSRSVLREMKGVLPAAGAGKARTDLRWIQEITGATRDLDVHLLSWPDTLRPLPRGAAADLQPLHDVLARHRRRAFVRMRGQLRGRRFAEAWQAWTDVLGRPLDGGEDSDRPNARRPVADVAGARIGAVYKAMVRMGNAIDDDSHPEALHELRKRGKELRYLLELYGQLWSHEVVGPMVSAMKGLQDVLGRFQDDEVQATYLRSLAPQLAAEPGGMDAVIALGVVIAGLSEDQWKARESLAQRFAPFASMPTRELVRATFGERR